MVENEKIMKVSQAAKILDVRPQAIHALVRKQRVETYELQGSTSRGVNVDEVQEALGGGGPRKRGRTKTNLSGDEVAEKFKFGEGAILYTVVEIKRRVRVVDEIRQEYVKLRSMHDESKWGGMAFMPNKLAEDLESGNVKLAEDNRAVLAALARSYRINGDDETAEELDAIVSRLRGDDVTAEEETE